MTNDESKPFKTRLKQLRKHSGLTQGELATKLGMPLRTLQAYENGERTPAPWVQNLLLSVLSEKD